MELEQLRVILSANTSQFRSQMNQVRNQMDQVNSNVTRSSSGITSAISKIGKVAAIAFSVKKMFDFGKESVELASNLNEVQNVVDVVFPSMRDQIDKVSKGMMQSAGLSETMAKKYIGTFGAMADAFGFTKEQSLGMSENLTQLTGDVASFYNISQDEAYTKLKSVFTGETETLKELGIVMTENALNQYAMANGYDKSIKKMSEAEKVALRYKFVMDKLKNASGDFERTGDNWANQIRVLKLQWDSLKASIGQGLIAILLPIVRFINAVLQRLNLMAQAISYIFGKIFGKSNSGTGGSALGINSDDVGAVSDSVGNLGSNVDGVGESADKTAKKLKKLMSFDEINRISDDEDSGSGAAGDLGNFDFDTSKFDTSALDAMDNRLDAIVDKVKDLVDTFKNGFKNGLGDDFEASLERTKQHLENIKKNVLDIFESPEVSSAMTRFEYSFVNMLGTITGSVVSIGQSIAENLVGGFDNWISSDKEWIKQKIASIFNCKADICDQVADTCKAVADIFEVLRSNQAKEFTGNIIGIVNDTVLGVTGVIANTGRDLLQIITQPIIDNKDKIKTCFEDCFTIGNTVLGTIKESIKDTFSHFDTVYDEHIKPCFDSIKAGVSDTFGKWLDVFHEKVAPIFQEVADKFKDTWEQHVQPVLNKISNVVGKVFDRIKAYYEKNLKPAVDWFIENALPVIAKFIGEYLENVINTLGTLCDIIGYFLDLLGDILDIGTDIMNKDWDKALGDIGNLFVDLIPDGIREDFENWWKWFSGKLADIGIAISDAEKSISEGWESIKQTLYEKWTEIKDNAYETWEGIKEYFSELWSGIVEGAEEAWNNLPEFFDWIWQSICDGANWAWTSLCDYLYGKWTEIKTNVSEIWTNIKDYIAEKWENIKTKTFEIWTNLKETLSGLWQNIKTNASEIWNGMLEFFGNIGTRIHDAVVGAFDRMKEGCRNALEGIKTVFSNVFNGLVTIAKQPINAVIYCINGLFRGINTIIGKINSISVDLPKELGGGHIGFNIPSVGEIPYLANGGVVNKATLAMIGEDGDEAVVPLKNNTQWTGSVANLIGDKLMESLLQYDTVRESGNNGLGQLIVNIGEDKLADIITDKINEEMRRQGKTIINV